MNEKLKFVQSATAKPAVLRALKDKHVLICERGNKLKIFAPEMKAEAKHKGSFFQLDILKISYIIVSLQIK